MAFAGDIPESKGLNSSIKQGLQKVNMELEINFIPNTEQ